MRSSSRLAVSTEKLLAIPHAILLDLDDTILDDSGSVDSAWCTVCETAAKDVNGLHAEDLLAAIMRKRDWYWSDPERHRVGRANLRAASRGIVQEALTSLGFDLPELATTIAESYRDLRDAAILLFPGAIDTLVDLRRRGISLGLITNGSGPAQRAKIERFGLVPYFDHILIEGEFGFGKPDSEVYLAAMAALGSSPERTWMVGDNLEWEVGAPGRLGLYTVWVDRTGRGLPPEATAQPNQILRTLAELPSLLDRPNT